MFELNSNEIRWGHISLISFQEATLQVPALVISPETKCISTGVWQTAPLKYIIRHKDVRLVRLVQ